MSEKTIREDALAAGAATHRKTAPRRAVRRTAFLIVRRMTIG
jgi:hypothetical protein